jgi:hypothetical protein
MGACRVVKILSVVVKLCAIQALKAVIPAFLIAVYAAPANENTGKKAMLKIISPCKEIKSPAKEKLILKKAPVKTGARLTIACILIKKEI